MVLSVVFALIVLAMSLDLSLNSFYTRIYDVSAWELTLLLLTVFRLIRLFVYDSVAQYVRDWFLDLREVKKDGELYIQRDKPKSGLRRLIADLLSCPWCASVWLSVVVIYLYLRFPQVWFIYLALSISGLASVLQICANCVGWTAEHKKLSTLDLEK